MVAALAGLAQERDPRCVDQEIALTEVLAQVDARRPELAAVVAAAQKGDSAAAQALLARHFAVRTRPVLPPASFPGVGEGNSMTVIGSGMDRQKADETWMRHIFTLSNNDAGVLETYDLGAQIDWLRNPSQALSWILYLNQLNHLAGLAGLYRSAPDEKYAIEVGASVLAWTRQCPRWYGYTHQGMLTPSGMEVRNRLCNLIAAYDLLRAAPSLSPDMHLAFWKMVIACCRELTVYDGVSYPGLIPAAVMFPEFVESADWLKAGEANLRVSLVDRTSPEGAWDTHSISYQTVPVPWAARVLEFLRANPESGDFSAMAEMVQVQMGKLLGTMLWLAMPNGGLPNIGDTYGRCDWGPAALGPKLASFIASQMPAAEQSRLNAIPDLFERTRATLASVTGAAGNEPSTASIGFSGTGYYVMRSGWQPKDATYVYYDLSPQSKGHAHNDATHVELYAHGKPLVVDTGDYFLGWGYRTALHNAVEVDGLQQERGAKAPMLPHEWLSTSAFDLADGAHGAYEHLGVSHRRKVLFVKPDYVLLCDLLASQGQHTYEQFFHFAGPTQREAALADIDPGSLSARTRHEGVANVLVAPAFTDGLSAALAEAQDTDMSPEEKYERKAMLGWLVTEGTFRRVRSAVAVYTREGAGPQAFHTVLFPVPAHGEAAVRMQTLAVQADGVPLAPFQAAGLVAHCEVCTPRHAPGSLQPVLGPNLALGRSGFADISQGSIAATTPLLTDGDPATRKLGGGAASGPYSPGVALSGHFGVELGAALEINAVRMHHGIWNGNAIIYPAERLTVEVWNGTVWEAAHNPVTTWHDEEVSLTCFTPVRTDKVRLAVERPGGGRLGARELEVYRIADDEQQRLETARRETTSTSWTETILIAHERHGPRQYGPFAFDGEFAIIRRSAEGRLTRVSVKGGCELREGDSVLVAAPAPVDYLTATWRDDVVEIEAAVTPGGLRLTAQGARRVRSGGQFQAARLADGVLALPVAPTAPPRIAGVQVELRPPQGGMAGAQPSALITWTTDTPATSQVRFTEANGGERRTPLDTRLKTEHRVTAYFLRPDRGYGFTLESVDACGNRSSVAVE
jgi:hypothetical protein